ESMSISFKFRRLPAGAALPAILLPARTPRASGPLVVARPAPGIDTGGRDCVLTGDLPGERGQVPQRAAVDAALEGDHVVERIPEIHPAPVVEFGLLAGVEAQVALGAGELQQEPDLLLADAHQP